MPYESPEQVAEKVRGTEKLTEKKRRQFMEVFNSCWEKHKDDKKCHMMAWGVVKKEGSMRRLNRIAMRVVRASVKGDGLRALVSALRVSPSARQIYERFLVFQEGSSNKFHYFGVFQERDGTCIGGNAYGRIGQVPKAIEIARGPRISVLSAVERKVRSKYAKGYVDGGEWM